MPYGDLPHTPHHRQCNVATIHKEQRVRKTWWWKH